RAATLVKEMITEEEFVQWIKTRGFKEKFYKFVQENQLKFEDYYSFTKEEWKEFLDGPIGIAVYNRLNSASTVQVVMDVDFKPENYSVPLELQFIQPNGIPKVLLGRTEQLKSIDAFMKLSNDKTRVISMGSTRGMGKTTMC
ncbi:hypothetical protein ROZALSC1DRAFT_26121, partial [Rozella allomycis CSF55]